MGTLNRLLDAIGRLSTIDWLLRLVPVVVLLGTWAAGYLQGWSLLTILIGGLVALVATLGLATLIHYWRRRYRESQLPEHHKVVLRELAQALAELKVSALTVGAWERVNPRPFQTEHARKHQEIQSRVTQLCDQISYDRATWSTCQDFSQLCGFIVYDAIHKQDFRTSRLELDKLGTGLFRFLHAGRSVDRSKIELPEWIKRNDEKELAEGERRDRTSLRRPM